MPIRGCFLDLDGVINAHGALGPLWRRHIGYVLARELGHDAADWGRVSGTVFPKVWEASKTWGSDPHERIELEATTYLGGMCEELAVETPTRARTLEIMRAVDIHVMRQCDGVDPKAPETLRALASRYEIHGASGNASWKVEALFEGMGIRDLLGQPFGPDLADVPKDRAEFYVRIFECTGVLAREAVVIDDSPAQLDLAARAGAKTILMHPEPAIGSFDARITAIEQLPAAVDTVRESLR